MKSANDANGQSATLPAIGAVIFLILWGAVAVAFFYELLTH